MKKRNRVYVGALAGVLVLLLLFTYISMQVYRRSLPVVETEDIQPGTVKRTYTMNGVLRYLSAQEVILPFPVIVSELCVEAGMAVGEGMAVLRLDTEYLEIEQIRLSIAIEEMLAREEAETDEEKRKLLTYDRKKKEAAAGRLEELLEADGVLYASCQGEVRAINTKEGAEESADKLLVSICDRRGGAELTWGMEEEGILFDRFYVDLRMTDGHNSFTDTAVLSDVTRSYDVKTNRVYYRAAVPETGNMLSMHDEEPLTVTAYYVSEVYAALLPASAVRFEADGTACVYELKSREKSFGTEYYVRKQTIEVSDRDAGHIATRSSLKDSRIVVNSSREIGDREIVWVEGW